MIQCRENPYFFTIHGINYISRRELVRLEFSSLILKNITDEK